MAERWRPVTGWEGFYEVSDQGRVRSLPRAKTKGTILKPYVRKDYGYHRVELSRPGFRSTRAVHTLVADAFVPNPNFYPLVRHLNGNPADNSAENLGWGTYRMNTEDAQRHGTMPTAQHGSKSKYVGGCRCDACREGNARHDRERRATDPDWADSRRTYFREYHRSRRAREKEDANV